MNQSQQTRPATAADFHRLADVAHERGLRLFRDGPRWYCSSASDPGHGYFVTGLSCTCQGFMAHQRCSHYALLLERLGWLPEVEPEMPFIARTPADYAACCGCGVQDFGRYALPCEVCGGTGVKPDHRLAGQPAVEIAAAA